MFVYRNFFLSYILCFAGLSFIVFFSPSLADGQDDSKVHICFFELDNTKTSGNFKSKLGGQTNCRKARQEFPDAVVHCYQPQYQPQKDQKEEARQAFERMIQTMSESEEKCDSLVLSGHHAGDWFGKTGKLRLKDMEALSCNPKYKSWFDNIKALWLDGCNTVTDKFVKSKGIIKTPDSETVRVLEKMDQTKLKKKHIKIVQQSYSASLDENTPFSSRYLRMFPNTQIYGFNGAAPDENQKGVQSFIYSHLINLGRAVKEEGYLQKVNKDFNRGLKAMFFSDSCDEDRIETWEKVSQQAHFKAVENQDYKMAYKLGCELIWAKQILDNPKSTSAQEALANQILSDSRHKDKRELLALATKVLNNPNPETAVKLAKASLIETLKSVNSADTGIGEEDLKYSYLLFNNLYDTWLTAKKYKTKDSVFFEQVKSEFREDSFSNSLENRIRSDYTASLRKGDYIKFYTEIHNIDIKANKKKANFVREHVNELLDKAEGVFKDLASPRKRNLNLDTKRVLAVSVVDQLFQYSLLNDRQMEELVENTQLFPPKTENTFIRDSRMRLKFTINSEEMISKVAQAREHSLFRRRAIRVGARVYLNQFSGNRSNVSAKKQLRELVDKIDVNDIKQGSDAYEFFEVLHDTLRGKTLPAKEELIYDLSKNTEPKLERLVLFYAKANLYPKDMGEKERLKQLYLKMRDRGTHRNMYILQ